MNRTRDSLLIAWLLFGGLIAADPAFSVEDDEEISSQAADQESLATRQSPAMQPDNIDRWIFLGRGDASTVRAQMHWQLGRKLDACVREHRITTAQMAKLTLAGSVDIERFFDELNALRRRFLAVDDRAARQALMQDALPLRQKMQADLFGDESLFAKTLHKMLKDARDEGQSEISEQARRHYRVSIEIYLIPLGEYLGLSDGQQLDFVRMVLAKTRPPAFSGTYDARQVFSQIAMMPDETWMPLLSERQCQRLSRRLEEYRGYEESMVRKAVQKHQAAQSGGAGHDGDLRP